MSSDLDGFLESYLTHGRDILSKPGIDTQDRVFITSKGGPYTSMTLSALFWSLTGTFLDEIPGIDAFRSHAWRHIVATGYLKLTRDFVTLALILHDRLETVLKHYAHMVPQDGFERYGAFLQSKMGNLNP